VGARASSCCEALLARSSRARISRQASARERRRGSGSWLSSVMSSRTLGTTWLAPWGIVWPSSRRMPRTALMRAGRVASQPERKQCKEVHACSEELAAEAAALARWYHW